MNRPGMPADAATLVAATATARALGEEVIDMFQPFMLAQTPANADEGAQDAWLAGAIVHAVLLAASSRGGCICGLVEGFAGGLGVYVGQVGAGEAEALRAVMRGLEQGADQSRARLVASGVAP